MKTPKSLCKSHITQLNKIAQQLAYKQTMSYTQLLLSLSNRKKTEQAEKLIRKAIDILYQIH